MNQIKFLSIVSFLCFSVLLLSQNITFKNIDDKEIISGLKIFNNKKFIGITNFKGEIKLEVSKNYSVVSEEFEEFNFFIRSNQKEIYVRKKQNLKSISSEEIKNLINKFQQCLMVDYQNSTYYEKFSYDYLENNKGETPKLKEDSILKIIELQKEKFVDYIQEQVFKFDDKNQKKIILEKNAGIGKSSFLNFINSKINPTIFKNKWIEIDKQIFLNPIFSENAEQYSYYFITNSCIEFSNSFSKGRFFLDENSIITSLEIFVKNQTEIFEGRFNFINNIIKNVEYHNFNSQNKLTSISWKQLDEKLKNKKQVNYNSLKSSKWNDKIEEFREDALTSKEIETFIKEDEFIKIENKIIFLNNILNKRKITIGKFEINPFELVSYNGYEGFRVQLSGGTSKKFSKKLRFPRYIAYGLKDKELKFGSGLEYLVSKKNNSTFAFSFANDVNPAGRNATRELISSNELLNQINNYNYDKYYKFQNFNASFSTDYISNLSFKIGLNYQMIESKFNFLYLNSNDFSTYNLATSRFQLNWFPRSKYAKTEYGKVTLQEKTPYFYFDFEKNWKIATTQFDYSKLNLRAIHTFNLLKGETSIVLNGGIILGKAPLTHLYEGLGTAKNYNNILERWGFSSNDVFETMIPGSFFSDSYASFHLKHKFNSFKIFSKDIYTQLIYRSLVGSIREENKILNSSFSFQTSTNFYQEVGVEFPKLFINKMLGIGVYYPIGNYTFKEFERNLFVKITVDLPQILK